MGKRKKTVGGGEGSEGGGRVKVYVHHVTDAAADLLNDRVDDRGSKSLLQTVSETSGADVQLDPSPSPVTEMKILVIRGLPKQIEKAVSLIIEKTGSEGTMSDQAEIFWVRWVQEAFPDLLSRAYFVPPVHVNRVPMERQTVADQDVLVLCSPGGQAGQSKESTLSDQDGQFDRLKPRGQTDLNIQPTPHAQSSHDKQPTLPEEPRHENQPTSLVHQSSQSMLPDNSYQSDQSTVSGYSYQSNQSTPLEEVGQCMEPAMICSAVRPSITPSRYGHVRDNASIGGDLEVGQCNQLTLSEQVSHFKERSPSEQCGEHSQSNQSIPRAHYYQSNQSIPPKQTEASHPVQTTPHDQSGQHIKQTSSRQSGQSSHSTRHIQPRSFNQSMPSKHFGHHKGFEASDSCPAQMSSSPLPAVQESDIRADNAMQRVLFCLDKMAAEKGEIMFGLSQFTFGQYLGEPCYAAAAASMPLAQTLPNASTNDKQGSFDVLLIHRHYGFVVCDVRAIGDSRNMSMSQLHIKIRNKLRNAISKLDKAEAMLSHLVSDIAPGLRITKTIAFPNLTARQVQNPVTGDPRLSQELCRCLGTSDPAAVTSLCLCCDQLSDPKTPCDVSSDVLKELGHWWTRRVAGAGHDSHMTDVVYTTLVARFCGPATSVTVPCTSSPRLSVKTLGQAVWWTGECYTAVITLFPEQVELLNQANPSVFVAGPPGTGKTVVLLLMAIQWLRCGHHVYVVSTWDGSHAVCSMLYHLLLQAVETLRSAGVSPGQPHLLLYNLKYGEDVEKTVNHLSSVARGGSPYVIADEAGPLYTKHFGTFCEKLLTRVQNLHLWAASCYHGHAPAGWQVEYLTRPLRSPPAVVRVVNKDSIIKKGKSVRRYSERGVPDHTDGPPVTRLYHRGQGHSGGWPEDCVTCGRDVASFLHSLRVGVTENVHTIPTTIASISNRTTPPCLQWRDVLMLIETSLYTISDDIGFLKGLREAGIPVRVMKNEDIEDVATARSDVVWVTEEKRVHGLERKVVVFVRERFRSISSSEKNCLHSVSRCTSQLVIVSQT